MATLTTAIRRILGQDEATEILTEARTKGMYEEAVNNFFDSGEMYIDVTAIFPKQEEANLKNNIKKYCKLQKIPFSIVNMENGDGTNHVILINLDAHRQAQLLAQQSDEQ